MTTKSAIPNQGRKILITYGNEIYYKSLQRLKNQAESTKIFDKIIIFTDKNLPQHIANHELMQYKRGGGYWLWKPYIIKKTLEEMGPDDIMIYSDAGNELFNHKDWKKWFRLLESRNAIFFKYHGLMKKWSHRKLLNYYSNRYHNIHEMCQLMGSISLWKKSALPIAQEWLDVMFNHPELAMDISEAERGEQLPQFVEHRHDQSVLTCVFHVLKKQHNAICLWEESEWYRSAGQAVYISRIDNSGVSRKGKNAHRQKPLWMRIAKRCLTILLDIREFIYNQIL